jgi:hypothetical protein
MSSNPSSPTRTPNRIRLPLVLPPPINSMGPRPLTTADRDAVRTDYVEAYDDLVREKNTVLNCEDPTERHAACRTLLNAIVSPFSLLSTVLCF